MKTRILSGLIMVPLLAVLYFGDYVLLAACLLIGVMAVREFYKGFEALEVKPCYTVAYAAVLGLYAINIFTKDYHWYMVWFFGCVLASLLYLFRIEERKLEDALATITGIFYIVFFSYHVLLVDQTGPYSILVWLIVLTAFGIKILLKTPHRITLPKTPPAEPSMVFLGLILGQSLCFPKNTPLKYAMISVPK